MLPNNLRSEQVWSYELTKSETYRYYSIDNFISSRHMGCLHNQFWRFRVIMHRYYSLIHDVIFVIFIYAHTDTLFFLYTYKKG
jgi:hypothetical protein